MSRGLGMLLTVAIIFATLAIVAWLENVGEGEESRQDRLSPVSPSSAQTIPQSEVKAMAEQAARYLDRGELVLALSPIALRDHGRCAWDLNTAFTIPDDIDRPYVRHRVRREAAIAGMQLAFGRHGDTRVFVTVMC